MLQTVNKWNERIVKRLLKICENKTILLDQTAKTIDRKTIASQAQNVDIKHFTIMNEEGALPELQKEFGMTIIGSQLVEISIEEAVNLYRNLLDVSQFIIISIPIKKLQKTKHNEWNHEAILARFEHVALHFSENEWASYVCVNPTHHTKQDVSDANQPLIAVYGIYKNEEAFIERFLDSVKNADEIVLCDTGSTDNTNTIIGRFIETHPDTKLNVYQICVSPWRFDDARNTALSLVHPDIDLCISLDIDEYLMDGWKEHLTKNWGFTFTRYFHKFSTIWPGGGASKHWHERIHVRMGYTWKLPVHEILEYQGQEKIKRLHDFWMYQKPDTAKSRTSYLPLLEQSVKERKDVWKSWSFLAAEYFKSRRYNDALKALDTALTIKDCDKGYLYKVKYQVYKAKKDYDRALVNLNQAISHLPTRREIRFEKAKFLHELNRNLEAYLMIKEAERYTKKYYDYHYNSSAWENDFEKWKDKLLELAKKEGLER